MKYSLFALLLVLCAASQDAQAATILRLRELNATGACQSALPVFDGSIRKRPKAVQNEGTSTAFITCSFTSEMPPREVHVYAISNDATSKTLSCQGIPGYNGESTPAVVRNKPLSTNHQALLIWRPLDWAENAVELPSRLFSISCALAPGVGIHNINIWFLEDIGA